MSQILIQNPLQQIKMILIDKVLLFFYLGYFILVTKLKMIYACKGFNKIFPDYRKNISIAYKIIL